MLRAFGAMPDAFGAIATARILRAWCWLVLVLCPQSSVLLRLRLNLSRAVSRPAFGAALSAGAALVAGIGAPPSGIFRRVDKLDNGE